MIEKLEPFPAAAHEALADPRLRANLRNATDTIRAKRNRVVAELPDWEELRDAGRAIKANTLARLDDYLIQFEQAVIAAGGHVHWARDAAEANAIVLDVARAHGVSEVVKVKSLTTDEIGLNDALAAGGVQAIETDFAELILQLDGDWSSHILVPAIHRNRTEIRDLFLRTIADATISDDPRELAEASRLYLREKFLTARMAVSGANFGVAETGTVCVVESEGNGRMCLTLPPVLVTVLGIEKLVPTFADLEVFLQLLPRSATGERMNPYTSLWTGVTAGDGPQEFHVVLLDAGRTRVLADEVGRQALHCIRCSACLNVCPVYSRTGGHAYGSVYPGPIGAILTPQLRGVEHAKSLPYASSLCGACYEVCPVKIDIPSVLLHLRAKAVEASGGRGERLVMKALGWIFAGTRRFKIAERLGRLSQRPFVRGSNDQAASRATRRLDADARPAAPLGRDLSPLVETATVSASREVILDRIRAAIADGPAARAVPRAYRQKGDLEPSARIALLCERIGDYRADVRQVAPAQLAEAIAAAFAARSARRVGIPAGIPAGWRPRGLELVEDGGLTPGELDRLDGVLTGCTLAIAETGTIVLTAGPAEGRRALTLVPDLHVCVVDEGQIVELVPEAMAALAVHAGRPITFISGPSATSDIELSRVEGVHGPRQLVVLVVSALDQAQRLEL